MAYSFLEVFNEIGYYCERILTGFTIKAVLATLPTLFAAYLTGDWYIFELWFIMNAIDLALGITLALKTRDPKTGRNRFSRRRVYSWVVKTLTHMLTIILVGLVTVAFSRVSGYSVPVIDWFMFILLLTEIASVLDSAGKLGLPIHPVAKSLVDRLRRKSEKKIEQLTNPEESEVSSYDKED